MKALIAFALLLSILISAAPAQTPAAAAKPAVVLPPARPCVVIDKVRVESVYEAEFKKSYPRVCIDWTNHTKFPVTMLQVNLVFKKKDGTIERYTEYTCFGPKDGMIMPGAAFVQQSAFAPRNFMTDDESSHPVQAKATAAIVFHPADADKGVTITDIKVSAATLPDGKPCARADFSIKNRTNRPVCEIWGKRRAVTADRQELKDYTGDWFCLFAADPKPIDPRTIMATDKTFLPGPWGVLPATVEMTPLVYGVRY